MELTNLSSAQCVQSQSGVGVMNNLLQILLQTLVTASCDISNKDNWPQDYGDEIYNKDGPLEEFDFVVIGAGSAGSVVASRLSENPNWRVLVLEAGGDPPMESEIPALFFTMQNTNFTYNYYTESNPRYCQAFKNRRCYWPRGKMIGGSGAINAMLYIRGNRRDYDNWLKSGIVDWGYDDVWPYFEKSTEIPTEDLTESFGYTTINNYGTQGLYDDYISQIILGAAKERYQPKVNDFVKGSYLGYAKVKSTTMRGLRSSTGKTYLARASKHRSNLKIIKNAQVVKLNFDTTGELISNVEFILRGNKKMKVKANKEFILSAGTIDSAKLLMLSGVGPQKHLENLEIPVVHDLPIGENLQDHVKVLLFYEVNNTLIPPISKRDILDNTYKYLLYKEGFLSNTGIVPLTAFLKVDHDISEEPYPNVEIHHIFFQQNDHTTLETVLKGESIDEQYNSFLKSILSKSHMILMFVTLANPKSKGQLSLKSPDYLEDLKIEPNYFADSADLNMLLKGVNATVASEDTEAFRQSNSSFIHIPIEECDQFEYKSEDYWKCYIKYFSTTLYHHVGTVKMAADSDPTGCVDNKLKLRGVKNARIVDASIMPSVPSCNTNAPTIMIAERAADFINQQWLPTAT